jgi:predicted enzyme related to lactoylglutathione lyase
MISYAPGTPCWVDLSTTDIDGARMFYAQLFGWAAEVVPAPEAGGYTFFRRNGKQVGAAGPAQSEGQPSAWMTYFATDDADAIAERVAGHGGMVLAAPFDVMESGRMAVFADPSGAIWAAWQAGQHQGAELINVPGSLTWNELLTRDITGGKEFYQHVLGVTTRDVASDGGEYTLLQVGPANVAGMMGFTPEMSVDIPSHWAVYFAVEDADATVARAVELGATVLMPPIDSPAGRFAMLTDPQGATFSIIQNDPTFTV